MGGQEWRMIGAVLGYAAAALAVAVGGGVGAAALYAVALQPIFLAMAALGAALSLGLAIAALWALRKGGPAPQRPPAQIAPGAFASATLVGLVLIGSGGATAVGLNDVAWLGLSMAVSALYAVFVLRPRRLPAQ